MVNSQFFASCSFFVAFVFFCSSIFLFWLTGSLPTAPAAFLYANLGFAIRFFAGWLPRRVAERIETGRKMPFETREM
jgi:hypothetical protein